MNKILTQQPLNELYGIGYPPVPVPPYDKELPQEFWEELWRAPKWSAPPPVLPS